MEYIMLKLISGDEIVGLTEGLDPNDKEYNIYDPHTITWSYDREGNYGMTIFPFFWAGEDRLFTFKAKDVIIATIPNKSLRDYYDQFTSKAAQEAEDEEFSEPANAPTSDLIQ